MKYFCPKCKNITYSLRYMTDDKWFKPKGETQYCLKCDSYRNAKDCIQGRHELLQGVK